MAVAVVALAVVLHDELPVALLDDGLLVGDLRLRQLVRGDVGGEELCHLGEVRRRFIGAEEDEAGDDRYMGAFERVAGLVEGHLPRRRGVDEVPVGRIGPRVVAAHEVARRPRLSGEHAGAPVAADVVEDVDAAVVGARTMSE